MKIYVDGCSLYKLSYFSLTLFLILIITGCGSTTPITKTYLDYIPPIIREGREVCLPEITQKLHECNEQANLEQQQCQANALATAQGDFQDALIQHANSVGKLQKQSASQLSEKGQAISNIAISLMDAMKPQLSSFVQDANCNSYNKCLAEYKQRYSKCGGNILYTTRCFANCVDKR